jgi:hypothetical protein
MMIFQKLLTFQRQNVVIHKDGTAAVGGGRAYKYATLPAVLDAVRPALSASGLVLTQVMDGGELVTRLVDCDTGEHIESRFPMSFDGLGWHQIGSAQTYARRYSLLGLLGLAPDDDDDAASAMAPAKTPSRFDRGNGEPVVALKRAEPPAMSGEYCDTCGDEMTVGPKTGKPYCHRCWAAKREHSRN